MDELYGDFMQVFRKPEIADTLLDILLCAVPIWVAVMIGLVIGWSWRPRWTGLVFLGFRSKFRLLWTAPPGFGARRLWFAFTALSAFSVCSRLWSNFKGKGREGSAVGDMLSKPAQSVERCAGINPCSADSDVEQDIVTVKDLEHLLHLLDGNVGDSAWQSLMERSTPNMTYQAWRHEPEVGPLMHRSRTVFEDATPELVRDFFWDDDFRPQWDPMLTYFRILKEYPLTGTTIVHWIKKFPFFCSDREYIIGRRIWESGKAYYCVTKAVPYPALHKHDKPRRVELYYSSWRIRAVESRKGDGQLTACEVTLVHYEDMGIPKDVAKVGVRHGMWGAVKKLQSGMRAYQLARKLEGCLSRNALMARITTKVPIDDGSLISLDLVSEVEEERHQSADLSTMDHRGAHWKWILLGGTVALACGLQSGVIGKAFLFGAARRLARN